jgi:hypothetical protein
MRPRPTIALLVLGLGVGIGATAVYDQVAHAKSGQTLTGHFRSAVFNPTASLTSADHAAVVSGPLECTPANAGATVRVTLVRRTSPTPAYGSGTWRGLCGKRQWQATVHSRQAFTAGTARACAFGVETRSGTAVDALLWCRTIRLVPS